MVFGKLFGSKDERKPAETLPAIGDATIGRALRIDRSPLAALDDGLDEETSTDFVVVAQGVAELADQSGSSWLHRFYDEDDRMLQVLTDSRDGGIPEEWSFYVPVASEHLAIGETVEAWRPRLQKANSSYNGRTFARIWYDGDDSDQPPVRFTETVFEQREQKDGRTIVQECMIYGADIAVGELLLLDLIMDAGADVSFERMLGVGLRDHHIGL